MTQIRDDGRMDYTYYILCKNFTFMNFLRLSTAHSKTMAEQGYTGILGSYSSGSQCVVPGTSSISIT